MNSFEQISILASFGYHCVCCTTQGRVFSWGWNDRGQLGNDTNDDSPLPIEITAQIPSEAGRVMSVHAGYNHSLCCTDQGRVFTWGCNDKGQLGDGTTADKARPVEITRNLYHCFFGRNSVLKAEVLSGKTDHDDNVEISPN